MGRSRSSYHVTEGGSRTVWGWCVTRGENPFCIRKPCETLYHRSSHWADPVESMNSLLALLGEPRSHSRWLLPPAAAINAISHWIMQDPQSIPYTC